MGEARNKVSVPCVTLCPPPQLALYSFVLLYLRKGSRGTVGLTESYLLGSWCLGGGGLESVGRAFKAE